MPQSNFLNEPAPTPPVNPLADPGPLTRRDACPSAEYHDGPRHDGQSTIRECAQCRRFLGFPKWYGNQGGRP